MPAREGLLLISSEEVPPGDMARSWVGLPKYGHWTRRSATDRGAGRVGIGQCQVLAGAARPAEVVRGYASEVGSSVPSPYKESSPAKAIAKLLFIGLLQQLFKLSPHLAETVNRLAEPGAAQ